MEFDPLGIYGDFCRQWCDINMTCLDLQLKAN